MTASSTPSTSSKGSKRKGVLKKEVRIKLQEKTRKYVMFLTGNIDLSHPEIQETDTEVLVLFPVTGSVTVTVEELRKLKQAAELYVRLERLRAEKDDQKAEELHQKLSNLLSSPKFDFASQVH
jgi:hypothetical protein